jgi:hypothetical protein
MNVSQQRDTTTIRQTVTFKASPQDIYETLMDTAKHEAARQRIDKGEL